MFPPRRTGTRLTLLAVLIAGAVGLAMIIVGLGGPIGWALIAPGVAAVLVSLGGIYRLRRSEIERAACTLGRGRAVGLRHDHPG